MNVIDVETIDMLKDVLADDFSDLIRVFLEDAGKRIHEIKLAIDGSDLPAIEKPAHTLKGSSSNIGALDLSSACDMLVKTCRTGLVEELLGSFVNVESEWGKVKPILLSYIE